MLRLKKADASKDVLEVIHHEVPDNAAGAGAAAIPTQRTADAAATAATAATAPSPAGYRDNGMTWRRMLRGVAITEVVGFAVVLGAGVYYGLEFFNPLAIGILLFAGAIAWLPRMSKASAIYGLVLSSLTLVMFGGLFFAWTGFLAPQSWWEMTFATLSVLVPIAGIVAAIATLRHHDGADAARTPWRVTAAVCAAVVLVGIVGAAVASDAARLPGDVALSASNVKFEQTHLTAKAGDVAIYFENKDPFQHNVRITGHGTSQNASGRQSIRHVFRNLAAGTYAFVCAIHPDEMKGTLTVT